MKLIYSKLKALAGVPPEFGAQARPQKAQTCSSFRGILTRRSFMCKVNFLQNASTGSQSINHYLYSANSQQNSSHGILQIEQLRSKPNSLIN